MLVFLTGVFICHASFFSLNYKAEVLEVLAQKDIVLQAKEMQDLKGFLLLVRDSLDHDLVDTYRKNYTKQLQLGQNTKNLYDEYGHELTYIYRKAIEKAGMKIHQAPLKRKMTAKSSGFREVLAFFSGAKEEEKGRDEEVGLSGNRAAYTHPESSGGFSVEYENRIYRILPSVNDLQIKIRAKSAEEFQAYYARYPVRRFTGKDIYEQRCKAQEASPDYGPEISDMTCAERTKYLSQKKCAKMVALDDLEITVPRFRCKKHKASCRKTSKEEIVYLDLASLTMTLEADPEVSFKDANRVRHNISGHVHLRKGSRAKSCDKDESSWLHSSRNSLEKYNDEELKLLFSENEISISKPISPQSNSAANSAGQ